MTASRPWLKPGFRIGSSWVARFDDRRERLLTLGKRITVWDVAARTRLGVGPELSHASHAEFAPDGCRAVVKNTSGEIVVFDVASLDELSRFSGTGHGEGTSAHFSPCGRFLVDGSWGGRLLVRDAETAAAVWEEPDAVGAIFDMRCTRDRAFWAYRRWTEATHPLLVRRWPFWEFDPVPVPAIMLASAFAVSDDRRSLAVSARDSLEVWELGTSGEARLRSSRRIESATPDVLSWSPDGRAIAHAGYRSVHVYDPDLSTSFSMPLRWACHVDFSPRADLIAFGDQSSGFVMPWPDGAGSVGGGEPA